MNVPALNICPACNQHMYWLPLAAGDFGVWHCRACAQAHAAECAERSRRAAITRKERHPDWAVPAHAEDYWQSKAHTLVAAAIRKGVLPKLDGSIACADCGCAAKEYDHRDYARPLDVEPVCIKCNRRRGTAKWPKAGDYVFAKVTTEQAA